MRIGITCYPTYGGSGAVATELGIALAARGHEVHFITYQQPFRLPNFLPRIFFHEVEVNRYPLFEYPPYDLALAVRMHEVVRSAQLERAEGRVAVLRMTSDAAAYTVVGPDGEEQRPASHGQQVELVLVWETGAWRVRDVR